FRDAMHNTLDRIAGFLPDRESPPRSSGWNVDDDEDIWPNDGWERDDPQPRNQPAPAENQPQRLVLSVSAGLSASAWWLRRWTGRLGLVSTAAVGLLASCTAY